LSSNKKLKHLVCDNNPIRKLEVKHLKQLEGLYCFRCVLGELDCGGLKHLKELYCANNYLPNPEDYAFLETDEEKKKKVFEAATKRAEELVGIDEILDNMEQELEKELNVKREEIKELSKQNVSGKSKKGKALKEKRKLLLKEIKLAEEKLKRKEEELIEEVEVLARIEIGKMVSMGRILGLDTCENLVELDCAENFIKELNISGLKKIKQVSCKQNDLKIINAKLLMVDNQDYPPFEQFLIQKREKRIKEILDNPDNYSLEDLLKLERRDLEEVSKELKEKLIELMRKKQEKEFVDELKKKFGKGYCFSTDKEENPNKKDVPPLEKDNSPSEEETPLNTPSDDEEEIPQDDKKTILDLQEQIKQLKAKIKELEVNNNENTPQKIEEIRQEILNSDLSEEQKRELEKMLEDISKTEIHKNKSDNKFPVGNNELEEVEIINCPQLQNIIVSHNQKLEQEEKTFTYVEKKADGTKETKTGKMKASKEVEPTLKKLNIKDCPEVRELYCSDNGLTDIDISQLNNLKVLAFDNNKFSSARQQELEDLGLDKENPTGNPIKVLNNDDFINNNEIEEIDISNEAVDNCKLEELVIEDCPNLKHLSFRFNKIEEIDLSGLDKLEGLYCSDNFLDELDLSNNLKLKHLVCDNNPIKELKVRHLKDLESLYCFRCKDVWELDCGGLEKLKELYCANNTDLGFNDFVDLNIDGCISLEVLDCAENSFEELVIADKPKLTFVSCKENELENLTITNCPNLVFLDFSMQRTDDDFSAKLNTDVNSLQKVFHDKGDITPD
ncbi:23845_t:CDS:2, partial [Racocetra persica]